MEVKSNLPIERISAHSSLFNVRIREVWRYRDLILLFVRRDFVAQYKQTILGPLWLVLQPLLTTLIFYIIFSKIAKIPTGGVDPILFYLSGITLWNYFSDCLTKTSNTFVANAGIFGKVYFPRLVIPLSVILSNLIKFGIQCMLLLLVFIVQSMRNDLTFNGNWALWILPLFILIMALMGLGLGLIFSALTVKYRDLSYLLTFSVQLLMYATPILYPLTFAKGTFRNVIAFNPLTSLFESFRYALFSTGAMDWLGMLYTVAFTLVAIVLGILVFNRVERSFMDTV